MAFSPLLIEVAQPWDDYTQSPINEYLSTTLQESESDITETTESQIENLSIDEPIQIAAGTKGATLYTNKILYTAYLPEYPDSDENGVAYVVNLKGQEEKKMEEIISNVQFCFARKHPPKVTQSPLLNDVKCKHYIWRCTGVKCCEFLHEDLEQLQSTVLNESDWQKIIQIRNYHQAYSIRREANSYFFAIKNQFQKKKTCSPFLDSCSYQFYQSAHATISNVPSYYIRCINSSKQNKHYFKAIPISLLPEIYFLRDRLQGVVDFSTENDKCHIVEQNTSRRLECGVDHLQGPGKLLHKSCEALFHLILPLQITETPFMIWVSIGKHTHPPPPPSRTPKEYLDGIIEIVHSINDPSLTTGGLLKNPALQEFCQKYNSTDLIQLHQSFANMDKISAIIYKQRLLLYPEGQYINGLQYEYWRQQQDPETQYIQYIHWDGENLMIICYFKAQAQLLATMESFEIDMSFKRLKDPTFKEIVITNLDKRQGKIMTLLRIIVNKESTLMYFNTFCTLFKHIEEKYDIKIQWQHLHGQGIGAVVTDMDFKQVSGFGQYLSFIDPQQNTWQWQIQHIIIYCRIHFQRGISRVLKKIPNTSSVIQTRMAQLLLCQSMEEYQHLCELLMNSPESPKAVSDWTMHKQNIIIACGLNKFCSKIDPQLFDRVRKHTNATEQTHSKSNSLDRQLSLLQAVKNGQILDMRDISQFNAKGQHGIHHNWRITSMTARFEQSERRDRSKRRRLDQIEIDPTLEKLQDDEDLEVLSQVSSSGVSRRSSRSRQSRRGSSQPQTPSKDRSFSLLQTPRRVASMNRIQQALDQDPDLQRKEKELNLREREANLKKIELENRKQELEIQKMEEEQKRR